MASIKKKICVTDFLRNLKAGEEKEFTIFQANQKSFSDLARTNGLKGIRTKKLTPTRFKVWKEKDVEEDYV